MKPDLDAIRARWAKRRGARTDVPVLLQYIETLEAAWRNERETFASCNRARQHCELECEDLRKRVAELEARTTYAAGETEWANRIAHAEARFVEEYDAHQETRKSLTNLFYRQLKADAEQMRSYGISYDGIRKLFAEYRDEELSVGKVVELLRAAAREMAREQVEELRARIVTLEAMR